MVPHAATQRQPPGFMYFSLAPGKCPNGTVAEVTTGTVVEVTSGTVAEVTTGTTCIAFNCHYDLRSLEKFL